MAGTLNTLVGAPSGSGSTLTVTAQSSGLSLLAPKMTVYAADGLTVLGTANGAGQYGTTLSVTVPNVSAGQVFYVQVQGADNTAMGTGRYALGMSFNGAAVLPQEASPIIAFPNGAILSAGGGEANFGANDNFLGAIPVVKGITPDTGASANDNITNANRLSIVGTAHQGDTIGVYLGGSLIGKTTADNSGNWTFNYTGTPLADGNYFFTACAIDSGGNAGDLSSPTMVTVDTQTPDAPLINGMTSAISINSSTAVTGDSTPTLFGTADPYSSVTLTSGGRSLGTAVADQNGAWNITLAPLYSGVLSITASATDVAGNSSAASATFTVFETASNSGLQSAGPTPEVTAAWIAASSVLGTSGNGAFTVTGDAPVINGTATSNAWVAVLVDNVVVGVVQATSSGNWTFTSSTLADGTDSISFESFNWVGNTYVDASSILIQVI